MSEWSLDQIFDSLNDDVRNHLKNIRRSFEHPGTKGDASERIWRKLFRDYLPHRYKTDTAHVVDSNGDFSDQIDIVVYDRQYSPLIFKYGGKKIIPAESIYAIFESKQDVSKNNIAYARKKVASVRRMYRTSLPIHHAGGENPPKELHRIIGGILALNSDWVPHLGEPLKEALGDGGGDDSLDIGCITTSGYFHFVPESKEYKLYYSNKAATAFLLELMAQLQPLATVPRIDVRAYARWLPKQSDP